jgi:hypothetical protein
MSAAEKGGLARPPQSHRKANAVKPKQFNFIFNFRNGFLLVPSL